MGSSSNEQVTAAAALVSPGITEKKKVDWDASEVERVHSQDDMQKDHQDYSRMDVSARKRLQCPTIMIHSCIDGKTVYRTRWPNMHPQQPSPSARRRIAA